MVFLLLFVPLALAAQRTAADSVVMRCIESDTSTRWQRMSAEWSRETTWTNDSLRRVLIQLAEEDQRIRSGAGIADSMQNAAFVARMRQRDSIDLVRLKEIVARFGWPTKSMVGAAGASAAFLIAQHNESYQPEVLRMLHALPPGEAQTSEVAMMEDRLNTRGGKAQRYGSQLKPVTGPVAEFYPIEDVSRLEERRASVGLPPMSVYICMMQGFMGREVKAP